MRRFKGAGQIALRSAGAIESTIFFTEQLASLHEFFEEKRRQIHPYIPENQIPCRSFFCVVCDFSRELINGKIEGSALLTLAKQ